MASHVNTVDALSDSDLDAPTQELPGGVEDATPPKPTMPIPSPKTPAKPKRPASSSAAAAPRASKSDAGAAFWDHTILQSCSHHICSGETYFINHCWVNPSQEIYHTVDHFIWEEPQTGEVLQICSWDVPPNSGEI